MSSFGIRRARSTDSRVGDSILDEDRLQIESEKIFKETGDASGANSPGVANLVTPAGNSLAKSGDTREGPMGNQFGIVEIINDEIDVSLGSQNFFPVIILNGEGGAADALTRIIPGSGVFFNQEQIVQAGSFAITLQETGGGNILTPGTAAFNLEPGDYAKLIFSIAAGNKWVVVWFSGNVGGGGGISFPIDFPEDDRGTVGASTQDILFTDSDRHSVKMIISGDVALAFSSPPTNETAYTNIIIVQDGTGGHTLTLPVGTVNKDIVEAGFLTGVDEETGIVVKFAFGVFYAFLETGNIVSGGAGIDQWSTFPAIQTVSMATNGMTGLTIANIVDVGSVARGSISGDATLGLVLSTASGGKLSIQDVITPIATFDDTTGLTIEGTHVINMNKNIINTIGSLQLDRTVTFTPLAIDTIGFDNATSAMKYNVALITDIHSFQAAGELLASISRIGSNEGQLSIEAVVANILQANEQVFIADSSTDPTINGQFRRNGVDTKVFSGGAVRNFSDIGVPIISNVISQLDSNVTVTDSGSNGLIQFTADGVLVAQMQNNRMDFQTTPVFGITTITFDNLQSIAATLSGIVMNFPDTNDAFDLQFNTVDAFHVDETKTLITSTIPNTAFALLHLFRDDPSPTDDDVVGEVQFRGRDSSATNIVYGKVGVEIEDATGATSTGSFQWTLRNQGIDQDMMSLKDGVLGVSRNSLLLAASQGAAMVLVRNDTSATIGDEAGELDFNINDGTERVFGNISVSFDNSSVGDDSSRMDFKLLTDDILRTIFTLRGSPITDNKISMEVGADSFIKASTGVMGYFVTNDPAITDSIGDNGTLQIPQFTNGSPSLAQLNAAAGAFDAAIIHDTSDGTLYVRNSASAWDFYTRSGQIT